MAGQREQIYRHSGWLIPAGMLLALLLLSGLLLFASCSDQKQKIAKAQVETDVKYTCPMHPEVVQNSPGKCPKCGMEMVHKD